MTPNSYEKLSIRRYVANRQPFNA